LRDFLTDVAEKMKPIFVFSKSPPRKLCCL